jgi:type IV pilus assembly protein PilA
VEKLKPAVEAFHSGAQRMPASNAEAGLPAADKLLGNYVSSIELKDGAFLVTFGNKAMTGLQGKLLSVRPVEVVDSPASPVSWICGHSQVPRGMQADGEDRTTVPPAMLPVACRDLAPATH